MINFFRRIRRQLANENKFQKYFKYAFGEVVLIMLGIFMALQLQNWNEKRKQKLQFQETLDQLYNKITDDSWTFEFVLRENQNILNTINNLLYYRDSIAFETLPLSLWEVALLKKESFKPKSLRILDNLVYNTEDSEQEKLANKLFNFLELIKLKNDDYFDFNNSIEDMLLEHNIPFPGFNHNEINRRFTTDSSQYNYKNLVNAQNLIKDENFITHLKTQRSMRSISILDYKVMYEETQTILNDIKKYYPKVKILYDDVGIIGTSINGFDDVGASSTPMTLTNKDQSIWEIELHLKKGSVKFRCRDSWAQNWGGESFPEGNAIYDGRDISVKEAGNYLVKLNLTMNTYEFIKLAD